MYYLGIDIGTTNLKAVLVNDRFEIAAEESASYGLRFLEGGGVEQNPDDWWRGVRAAVGSLGRRGIPLHEIRSLAVSGHGCALVAIDREGHPLRQAISSLDTRCSMQTEQIRQMSAAQIEEINGNGVGAFNFEPKLLWIKQNEPEFYDRMSCFLSPTSYVNYRFTGNRVMNVSDGGIAMAYHRKEGGRWSNDIIACLGLDPDKFPALAKCEEVIGTVTREAAAATGLPAGIPVLAGGEDTSSAALAMGVTLPGMAYLSMGTQCTVGVCTDRFTTCRELLGFPHVLPGQHLINGSMSTCGGGINWFVNEWCRDLSEKCESKDQVFAMLMDEVKHTLPGAMGLLFLPYLSGELHPILDATARGVFFGLKLEHVRGDMARAVMEGSAHAIKHNLDFAESVAGGVSELRAVGGPAKSEVWCQAIADITGKPVKIMGKDGSFGGAALGDAILAMGAIEHASVDSLAERFLHIEREYVPNESSREMYERQHIVYKRLYMQLKELYPLLTS